MKSGLWKVTGHETNASGKVRRITTYSNIKIPGVEVLSKRIAQPHANREGEWFYTEFEVDFRDGTKLICHSRSQAFEVAEKSIYSQTGENKNEG